jgi:hypothetical protein
MNCSFMSYTLPQILSSFWRIKLQRICWQGNCECWNLLACYQIYPIRSKRRNSISTRSTEYKLQDINETRSRWSLTIMSSETPYCNTGRD